MDAEGAYLFRHGVLRDAAYDLMPPSFRATLHGLVADCVISLFRGRLDGVSAEIANHLALAGPTRAADELDFRERAAKHAERVYAGEEAVTHLELLAANEGLTPYRRVRALEKMFSILEDTGKHAHAMRVVEQVTELAGDDEELRLLAGAVRARVAVRNGELDTAERLYLEQVEGFGRRGDLEREIGALGNLNTVYKTRGQFDQAEAALRRCLELATQVGNQHQVCLTLANLATLHGYREQYDRAEEYAQRAIELARKGDERAIEGATLTTLALVYRRQGRLDESERTYLRGLEILREIGSRLYEGVALGNLGSVLETQGRHSEAKELYQRAIELHRQTGNRRFEGIHLGALAMVTWNQGDRAEGERMLREAIELTKQAGDVKMSKGFETTLEHWRKS